MSRVIVLCLVGVVIVLAGLGTWLVLTLPDANAFNTQVERIFIENDALTDAEDIKLLEILAQSGTAFADTLAGYRMVIFVLLVFGTAMMVAALVFLVLSLQLNRRMGEVERKGLEVGALMISRAENLVYLNTLEIKLTDAAMETLSVLAEARMDGDVLTGAELEGMITGKPAADCDEAAGATRIKRLRDTLGNQMVAQLLIRNIARQGYVLAIDSDVIEMV